MSSTNRPYSLANKPETHTHTHTAILVQIRRTDKQLYGYVCLWLIKSIYVRERAVNLVIRRVQCWYILAHVYTCV